MQEAPGNRSGICRSGWLAFPDLSMRNGIGQGYGGFQGWRACASQKESWMPPTIRKSLQPKRKAARQGWVPIRLAVGNPRGPLK